MACSFATRGRSPSCSQPEHSVQHQVCKSWQKRSRLAGMARQVWLREWKLETTIQDAPFLSLSVRGIYLIVGQVQVEGAEKLHLSKVCPLESGAPRLHRCEGRLRANTNSRASDEFCEGRETGRRDCELEGWKMFLRPRQRRAGKVRGVRWEVRSATGPPMSGQARRTSSAMGSAKA